MPEKVYVDEKKIGTFACPKCKKLWKKDFSKIKDFTQKSLLNVNRLVAAGSIRRPIGCSVPLVS